MYLDEKPYFRITELARYFDVSVPTMRKWLREANVKKYVFGYNADEIKRKFHIKSRPEPAMKNINNNIIQEKGEINNGQ